MKWQKDAKTHKKKEGLSNKSEKITMTLGRCLTLLFTWVRRGTWLERNLQSFSIPNLRLWGSYRISGPPRLSYEETGQRRKGALPTPPTELVAGTRSKWSLGSWLAHNLSHCPPPLSWESMSYPTSQIWNFPYSRQWEVAGQQANITAVIVSLPLVHFICEPKIE